MKGEIIPSEAATLAYAERGPLKGTPEPTGLPPCTGLEHGGWRQQWHPEEARRNAVASNLSRPDAQRFAQEPPPHGACWPDVAHEAEVTFVYAKEPHEPGDHLCLLLAYDAERNKVGCKGLEGWGQSRAGYCEGLFSCPWGLCSASSAAS